jgi:hypothetical protein
MAAKINRVIVSLHARCPNNTERLPVFAANIISRRRNVLPPKADISRRNRQCPLWAKSEHRLRTHRENRGPPIQSADFEIKIGYARQGQFGSHPRQLGLSIR